MKQDKDKAINAAGYTVLESGTNSTEVTFESQGLLSKQTFSVKPYAFGITAAAAAVALDRRLSIRRRIISTITTIIAPDVSIPDVRKASCYG